MMLIITKITLLVPEVKFLHHFATWQPYFDKILSISLKLSSCHTMNNIVLLHLCMKETNYQLPYNYYYMKSFMVL